MMRLFFIASLLLTFNINAQNQIVKDKKGNDILLGITTKKGLKTQPFSTWFNTNYNNYIINKGIAKQLNTYLKDYKIKAFFGSWCGDSKQELPRLYKILEAVNFNKNNLEVIALHIDGNNYKQALNNEEKDLNIHRVPTFILYKNGKEVNRIVEHPKETIERDLLKIVTNKPYNPNYIVVSYLENALKAQGIDSLKMQESTLVPYLAEYTKGSRELNTYGYVKLRSGAIDEAIYIFDLNTKLYPYKHSVFDSLAEAYFINKNYTEALKNYAKVLALKPDNENALKMIEEIKLHL